MWTLHIVKQTLKDQFIHQWQENIISQNKCAMYTSFKQNFAVEDYLLHNTSIYSLPLPTETGRYIKSAAKDVLNYPLG